MAKLLTTSTSYQHLSDVLGNRDEKAIGNNTVLRRVRNFDPATADIAVRLHRTDVVTVRRNGNVTLNSGGWQTVTTMDRINAFTYGLGVRLCQRKGEWFLWTVATDTVIPFYDGITLDQDGQVVA